ncbi:MAG: helix-turn-helix transcriptional regulator [Micrococcaceae bacterium]
MARKVSYKINNAAKNIGVQLQSWRKLSNLTAQQVADKAGISRTTLQKIEHGDPSVSFLAILSTARVLGVLDKLIEATDPYKTPLGIAKSELLLKKRIR